MEKRDPDVSSLQEEARELKECIEVSLSKITSLVKFLDIYGILIKQWKKNDSLLVAYGQKVREENIRKDDLVAEFEYLIDENVSTGLHLAREFLDEALDLHIGYRNKLVLDMVFLVNNAEVCKYNFRHGLPFTEEELVTQQQHFTQQKRQKDIIARNVMRVANEAGIALEDIGFKFIVDTLVREHGVIDLQGEGEKPEERFLLACSELAKRPLNPAGYLYLERAATMLFYELAKDSIYFSLSPTDERFARIQGIFDTLGNAYKERVPESVEAYRQLSKQSFKIVEALAKYIKDN
jgi:hypothetical protein